MRWNSDCFVGDSEAPSWLGVAVKVTPETTGGAASRRKAGKTGVVVVIVVAAVFVAMSVVSVDGPFAEIVAVVKPQSPRRPLGPTVSDGAEGPVTLRAHCVTKDGPAYGAGICGLCGWTLADVADVADVVVVDVDVVAAYCF